MEYIEIAVKKPNNTWLRYTTMLNPEEIHLVSQSQKRGHEYHRSHWRLPQEAKLYVEEHSTLKDYTDSYLPDHVLLDFDMEGKFLTDRWYKSIKRFCRTYLKWHYDYLQEWGYENNIILYFSGRGFHLLIHKDCFDLEPSPYLPYIVKDTVKNWWRENCSMLYDANIQFDPQLYTTSSTYRMPNTYNAKSGRYKTWVLPEELNHKEIPEIGKHTRGKYPYPFEGDGEFIDYQPDTEELIKRIESQKEASRPRVGHCINSIWAMGPQESKDSYGRHNIVNRLASWMNFQSFPMDIAKTTIHGWYEKHNFDYDIEDTDRAIEEMYTQDYNYGCNDHIMDDLCSPECKLYDKKINSNSKSKGGSQPWKNTLKNRSIK